MDEAVCYYEIFGKWSNIQGSSNWDKVALFYAFKVSEKKSGIFLVVSEISLFLKEML